MLIHGSAKTRRTRTPADPEWVKFLDPEALKENQLQETLQMSLSDAGLAVRTVNTLEGVNIFTVGDLADADMEELLKIPNFGAITAKKCLRALDFLGVPFVS